MAHQITRSLQPARGVKVSRFTSLTNDIALRAKAQRVPRFDRARLRFAWVESGRHRDPDNIASAKKFLLDGLVLAGGLPGDGWAHVAGWTDTFEVGPRAGVEVTIEAA